MRPTETAAENATEGTSSSRTSLRGFFRSKDGSAAIEFAILAIPYFMIVFAIVETFVAFTAEQLVAGAVDTISRRMRTGQITYNLGRTTDMTQVQFRTAFCDEISILIKCSSSEIATPDRLYLDARAFTNFKDIPTTLPLTVSGSATTLDTSTFKYTPGGPSSINMLRAYYRWQITADLVRPYITNLRPGGSMPSDFLIVSTAAFQNEAFP